MQTSQNFWCDTRSPLHGSTDALIVSLPVHLPLPPPPFAEEPKKVVLVKEKKEEKKGKWRMCQALDVYAVKLAEISIHCSVFTYWYCKRQASTFEMFDKPWMGCCCWFEFDKPCMGCCYWFEFDKPCMGCCYWFEFDKPCMGCCYWV
jgi:hypothetical protein